MTASPAKLQKRLFVFEEQRGTKVPTKTSLNTEMMLKERGIKDRNMMFCIWMGR